MTPDSYAAPSDSSPLPAWAAGTSLALFVVFAMVLGALPNHPDDRRPEPATWVSLDRR